MLRIAGLPAPIGERRSPDAPSRNEPRWYTSSVRPLSRWIVSATLALALVAITVSQVARASSIDELLASAERHIAAGEEEIALRRYTDALTLDPTCEACYLGLGALREKRVDLREADRVYTAALVRRVPPVAVLIARARVRWALGFREDALADLEDAVSREPGAEGLRRLGGYYAELRMVPARLRVARQLLALGERNADEAIIREARILSTALALVAGPADPVTQPVKADAVRRALAKAARWSAAVSYK